MKRKASPPIEVINIKFSPKEEGSLVSHNKESVTSCEYRVSDSRLPRDAYSYTDLHYAAAEGDAHRCQKILKNFPDAVTYDTYHGYLPLDLAAKNGRLEVCEVLKANMTTEKIYAIRPYGYTTLELIAKKDDITDCHWKIFKALIDDVPKNMHSIAINTKLLHIAILKGHPELCEIILEKNPNSLSDVDAHGYNAFHFAAQTGFEKVIKKLVDNACVKDVKNALLTEKELNNSQNNDARKYLDHSSTEITLKVISQKAIEYIAGREYKTEHLKSFEENFYFHLKWLKLYHIMYDKGSHKDPLIDNRQIYQELLSSAKHYYVENFFKIIGICKKIARDHLFAVLNDNFTKNTITMIVEQSLSDSCKDILHSEDVLPTTCIGEDSSLN